MRSVINEGLTYTVWQAIAAGQPDDSLQLAVDLAISGLKVSA